MPPTDDTQHILVEARTAAQILMGLAGELGGRGQYDPAGKAAMGAQVILVLAARLATATPPSPAEAPSE